MYNNLKILHTISIKTSSRFDTEGKLLDNPSVKDIK